MSKDLLGLGVIGAGLIGAMHCQSLNLIATNELLPVRLAHIADQDGKRAESYGKSFGFARASADAQAVLDDPAVDAVYILTWPSEHPALVKEAARRGKHVFCEKPLAFTAAEARAMKAAVDDKSLANQVGLVLRQGPVWNVLRRELQTRAAGFPVTFVFRDDQCFPIKGAHPSTWRKDPARAGHGTLIEHSIHDLDLVEWLFGPVTSIRAETAHRFGVAEIEDLARVDLHFASGMTGTLVSAWHDVENRHSDRRLEIFFEKLFCFCESEFTGPLYFQEGQGRLERMEEEEVNRRFWESRGIEDPLLQKLSLQFGLLEDFLFCRAALNGEKSEPDFAAAVRAHQLVDACYQSAENGERVRLPQNH